MWLGFEFNLNWGFVVEWGILFCLILPYLHAYWYFLALREGRVSYSLKKGDQPLSFRLWLVLKFYEKLGDFLEAADFYLAVYSPFFYFLRWNEFFTGLIMQKAVYNWRLKAVTYKCDFEEAGEEVLYNKLLFRWETGFFYIWVGCLATFKLMAKLAYMFFAFFFVAVCYWAKIVLLNSVLGLHVYDAGRYCWAYFCKSALNSLTYDALYKVWLAFGHLRYELIFWAHNVPYTFFFSSLITMANAIWFNLFSFYNWATFKRGRGVNYTPIGMKFIEKCKNKAPLVEKMQTGLARSMLAGQACLMRLRLAGFLWLTWVSVKGAKVAGLLSEYKSAGWLCVSCDLFFYNVGVQFTEAYWFVSVIWGKSLRFICKSAMLILKAASLGLIVAGVGYCCYKAGPFLGWSKVVLLVRSANSHILNILREEWIFGWLGGFGEGLWGFEHISSLRLSLGDVFEFQIQESKDDIRNYMQYALGEDIPALKAFWRGLVAGFDIWTFDRFKMRDKLYQFWTYGIFFHSSDYIALWLAYFKSFIWLKVYPTINPFFFLEDSIFYSFFFLAQAIVASIRCACYCLYLLPVFAVPSYLMAPISEIFHVSFGATYMLGSEGISFTSTAQLAWSKINKAAFSSIAAFTVAINSLFLDSKSVMMVYWFVKNFSHLVWAQINSLLSVYAPNPAGLAHYNINEFWQITFDRFASAFRISRFNISMSNFSFSEECELSNMLVDGEAYCWVDEPEAHGYGDVIDHVRTKSATLYRKDWLLFSYNYATLYAIFSSVAPDAGFSPYFFANLIAPVQARVLRYYFIFIYLAAFLCFNYTACRQFNINYFWEKNDMDQRYQWFTASRIGHARFEKLNLARESLREKRFLDDDDCENGDWFINDTSRDISRHEFSQRLGDDWYLPRGKHYMMNCSTDSLPEGRVWAEFHELRSSLVEGAHRPGGLSVSSFVLSYFSLIDWALFGGKGPSWLLNKNCATFSVQRVKGNTFVIKPELALWNVQFYWVVLLPCAYFTFVFGDKFLVFYQKISLVFYLSLLLENCNFLYEFNGQYVQIFHSYSGVDFGPFSKTMYKANEGDFSYAIWNAGFLDYLVDYKDIKGWATLGLKIRATHAESSCLFSIWAGQRLVLIVLLIPLVTRAKKSLSLRLNLSERYALAHYVFNHYRFNLKKYVRN